MGGTLDILYSFRRCPYAMRARLALQVSQRSCQLREVLLRDKPTALLEVSPKATVPVVQTIGGDILEESLDIMRWCLKGSDPQSWLCPERGSPGDMLALIARNDGDFKHHLDRYKYGSRHEPAAVDMHRAAAALFLAELDARLAVSPWLFGQRLALADAAIAPFVRQFANTDRSWFDAQAWPGLRRWLDDFLSSPLFVAVMHKHQPWQPGGPLVVFPSCEDAQWHRSL